MKLTKKVTSGKEKEEGNYDQYIALDWSEKTMAVGKFRSNSSKPQIVEEKSDLKYLKKYLKGIPGRKILTIEETTSTHWLYVELKECVDKIFICDPYRNKLLSEGAKTDKIDAGKLSLLLRGGLLKEVYHSDEESYKIRKIVSAYDDLVKAGVRVQNQKSAIYRGLGLKYKKDTIPEDDKIMCNVEESQNKFIDLYRDEKKKYEILFSQLKRSNATIKKLTEISGIGDIIAVTIYSTVIDANRFATKYQYWSYCGLTYNMKESGGRNYGRRRPRHSRKLRGVYKTAVVAAIGGKNDIRQYYEYLLSEGYPIKKAQSAIARYISKVSYAVMKTGESYRPYQWRENEKIKQVISNEK